MRRLTQLVSIDGELSACGRRTCTRRRSLQASCMPAGSSVCPEVTSDRSALAGLPSFARPKPPSTLPLARFPRSEFQYRFNRRFDLRSILSRLVHVASTTKPGETPGLTKPSCLGLAPLARL
jgi:hypothetical protein